MQSEKSKVEKEALEILRVLQKRDFKQMDRQMTMAKEDVFRDMSFGRLGFSIPTDHFEVLSTAFPLLNCKDGREASKEWKRVSKLGICLPYLVNSKQRSM